MRNHSRLCFAILWVLAACALIPAFLSSGSWAVSITFNLVFAGAAIYGSLRADCAWFGPVVTSFRPVHKQVWLTIDDGPDADYTPKTLRILQRFNARATFFLVGNKVDAHPDLARSIIAYGHTIGNHSATHSYRSFWAAGPKMAVREIDGGTAAIERATATSPTLFRAPVGIANCFVRAALRDRKMSLIAWSARGFDGVSGATGKIVPRVFSTIRPGAIVLLHEGSSRGRQKRDNLAALETILSRLTREGYSCVIPEPQQLTAKDEFKSSSNEFARPRGEQVILDRT